jgi:hypothetical protein
MDRLGAIDCECGEMSPTSTQWSECIASRVLGTQHSLSFLRVKRAAAFVSGNKKYEARTNRSQATPAPRQLRTGVRLVLLELLRIFQFLLFVGRS